MNFRGSIWIGCAMMRMCYESGSSSCNLKMIHQVLNCHQACTHSNCYEIDKAVSWSQVLKLRRHHFDEHLSCLLIFNWLLLRVEFGEYENTFSRAASILVKSSLVSTSHLSILVKVVLNLALQVGLFDLGNSLENVWLVASPSAVLPLHESFWILCAS